MQAPQRVLRQGAAAADAVGGSGGGVYVWWENLWPNLTQRDRSIPCTHMYTSLRALGDAYLKYPEFNGRPNRSDSSAGRYIPPPYTPPYITATPEVVS